MNRLVATLMLSGVAACMTPQPVETPKGPAPPTATPQATVTQPPATTEPGRPTIAERPPVAERPTETKDVPSRDLRAEAAGIAMSMLGKPYRRGGHTPKGFDCSGLVHYSYAQLSQDVPRDTAGLRDASRPIETAELKYGDLVFFNIRRRHYSHVGIYVGDGQFVHAPASGGRVRMERMSLEYWSQRFAGARRLLIAAQSL